MVKKASTLLLTVTWMPLTPISDAPPLMVLPLISSGLARLAMFPPPAVPPARLVPEIRFAWFAVCEVFTPSMTLLASVKFVTFVPKTPLVPMFVIFMKLNDGEVVELRETAWLVVFWIVPPVQVEPSEVQVPALPVTVKPPLEPVLFSTIPLDEPFAEMLRNVMPLAPMVVLATLSAIPVVEEIVLTIVVLFWV